MRLKRIVEAPDLIGRGVQLHWGGTGLVPILVLYMLPIPIFLNAANPLPT